MKKSLNKWERFTILGLTLFLVIGLINVGVGSVVVQANNTAQNIPFTQDWTNKSLITANDDWSAVPGIIGYRGDDLTTAIDADARTILADGSATPVDVNNDQTSPDTYTTGGVTEFDIANPVVALQGSGTADVPHLVFYLNTTGKTNIKFAYNARDIDGSADDAVQQINTQYRVGNTGDFINLSGGYIADATTGGTATQVTAVSVTLPAAAENKALVQVRVMTVNALGSDEWVGIDDINVTSGAGTTPTAAKSTLFDFTGNGRTDFTTLAVPTLGAIRWKIAANPATPGANQAFIRGFDYGLSNIVSTPNGNVQTGDVIVPQDYSGDNKTEVAVWRPGAQSNFFVAQFPVGTGPLSIERTVPFGITSDNPNAVGDYDGDGKIDYTVSRVNNNIITWYSILSATNTMRAVALGVPSNAVGYAVVNGSDFNGDKRDELVLVTLSGECDFVAGTVCSVTYYANDAVNGTGVFTRQFGNFNSDYSVTPADYTGDGRADLVAVRQTSAGQVWYINNSVTNTTTGTTFGIGDTNARFDFQLRGDYDGDGRQDIAVWRISNQTFYYIGSATGTIGTQKFGDAGDTPLGSFGIF